MKVLVYGAGIQGSLLAHVLVRANQDVTVLARGRRAEELRDSGLVIRHYLQFKTTVDPVKVIIDLEREDRYDVIFVTMKYTDFPQVLPALAQNCSENIILVGNNATASEMQAYLEAHSVKHKNVAFAFQISGGSRGDNRITAIRFNAGAMVVGVLGGGEIPFKRVLEQMFKNSKYKIKYERNIDAWLKSHMISIIPLNLAAVIKNNHLKSVARDNELLKQVVDAMDEGFDVLKALGVEVIPAKPADWVKKHKRLNRVFYKLYHYSPLAAKIEGSALEIEGLVQGFYALKKNGPDTATPNFDALVKQATK
ncbi:ketopantoate reductase family protein [Paenibacillus sp. NFR01]|uniref:ketopantoate reductase family protein n=1 Tax=Paenibacillus sp. NFR01 TaxID=1566279 RepID=UPI0008B65152|nr:2-dehydropantoate 2-reductase N-terminal domain-containing protein [Paenibacillus sp. NFR01]SET09043.1 2-dehydropantoate 2-reductase [Paenibacillus sp. NFR01]